MCWLFSEVGANSSESSFQGGKIIGKGDKSEAGAVGEANLIYVYIKNKTYLA